MTSNTDLKKLADALMSASKAISAIYEIAEKAEPDQTPFAIRHLVNPKFANEQHKEIPFQVVSTPFEDHVVPAKKGYWTDIRESYMEYNEGRYLLKERRYVAKGVYVKI